MRAVETDLKVIVKEDPERILGLDSFLTVIFASPIPDISAISD